MTYHNEAQIWSEQHHPTQTSLLFPTWKISGVSSPDRSVKFAVVSEVPYKATGVLMWSSTLPGPCRIMCSRDLETCPPRPRVPPTLSQATEDSVCLQLPRRINLNSVHSQMAQSWTCGYRTVYVNIVLYFSSSLLEHPPPPKWFIRIILIVVIF